MSKRPQRKKSKGRSVTLGGINLDGRPGNPANKRPYASGQHGQNPRKKSPYGVQLAAKQKLKFSYANIMEKQFRRIFDKAASMKGDTSENFIGLLESRLDVAVYRLKFVISMQTARQFVNHGHVLVNGKRVNIPSYQLQPGDKVSIRPASQNIAFVAESLGSSERDVPEYWELDLKKFEGTFVRIPTLADVPYPVEMQPNLVVEYYAQN